MKLLEKCFASKDASIIEVIEIIDKGCLQTALVVDEERVLLGIVTDGDIRRAIIKKIDLKSSVAEIMNAHPIFVYEGQTKDEIRNLMSKKIVHQVPVLDVRGRVVDLVSFAELLGSYKYDNTVVLMVGGLGTRLKHLTKDCPKPLLKVGNKPILETILESFIEKGFYNFVFSVNYKADMIEEYFGDGSKFGVHIRYVKEKERLGTAGALGLLNEKYEKPLIVMNGDILTRVDFSVLLNYHLSENAVATMAVREYVTQVPYGVIEMEDNQIVSMKEKPQETHLVNAGIYILNPEIVSEIPENMYLDMPKLFESLIIEGRKTVAFPIREYWLDIGKMDDFERAQVDYFTFIKD